MVYYRKLLINRNNLITHDSVFVIISTDVVFYLKTQNSNKN